MSDQERTMRHGELAERMWAAEAAWLASTNQGRRRGDEALHDAYKATLLEWRDARQAFTGEKECATTTT